MGQFGSKDELAAAAIGNTWFNVMYSFLLGMSSAFGMPLDISLWELAAVANNCTENTVDASAQRHHRMSSHVSKQQPVPEL